MHKQQELSPLQKERVHELTVEGLDRVLRGIAEKRVEAKQNREWHYLVETEFNRLREMAEDSVRDEMASEEDVELRRGMEVLDEQADETIRELGRKHRQKRARK